jgi:hypothetical protein
MVSGFIDTPKEVRTLIDFAKDNEVEQLTLRPVNKPEDTQNMEVWNWTNEHQLRDESKKSILDYLEGKGHRLMTLAHGAYVYDVDGQNVCLTHSLTIDASSDDIRQLIFFPDGHVRYDWQYPGAILF